LIYSLSYYKSNKLYFKHNTSFDSGEIDYLKQEFIEKAKRNGLPTEDQKEEYLISESIWSKESNEKIKKLKSDISTLRQTKSKLFKSDDINEFNKQINEKKLELITLTVERKDLLGFTVEDYANKKINEYYMFNSLFKDKNLKDRYFSEQEFDELENKDISFKIYPIPFVCYSPQDKYRILYIYVSVVLQLLKFSQHRNY
jgi:hypothetical protein